MNHSIINGELIVNYPEGFSLMDSGQLEKFFGTSNNMFGIHSEEQHIIMSFAWNKVNMLLSVLADQKSVVNGMEKRLKNNLKNFHRTSDISMHICGVSAKGFSFEYIAHDADIAQVGNYISFKLGRCLYVIQFSARKDHSCEANELFHEIIASLTLKEL